MLDEGAHRWHRRGRAGAPGRPAAIRPSPNAERTAAVSSAHPVGNPVAGSTTVAGSTSVEGGVFRWQYQSLGCGEKNTGVEPSGHTGSGTTAAVGLVTDAFRTTSLPAVTGVIVTASTIVGPGGNPGPVDTGDGATVDDGATAAVELLLLLDDEVESGVCPNAISASENTMITAATAATIRRRAAFR